MQILLKQLLQQWRFEDIQYLKGESIEAIHHIEESLGYCFPSEFVDYLQTVNGMEEGESDNDLFYFWSSELIKSEVKEFKTAGPDSIFIGFADRIVIDSVYMIEVSKVRKVSGRVSIKKRDNQIIAPNFKVFLNNYLNNLDQHLPQWEKPVDRESKTSPLSLFFQNLLPNQLASVI
jgi:hypothetical protein